MVKKRVLSGLVLLLIVGGTAVMGWWLFHDPSNDLKASVPGMDMLGTGNREVAAEVKIGEKFTAYGKAEEIPGAGWPNFRGPGFDNIAGEQIPLTEKFGDPGGRIRWRVALGEGHAAPAVYGGRVYLLDYDEKARTDALRCFSLVGGRELWRREYRVHLKRNHGLSRTIPAVNSRYAVTIGPKCQVMCVDRVTGDLKWGLDLVKQFGTEVPFWYTGQCPLLDGDTLVVAPGGKALMAGIDCATGRPVWETPNPKQWKMSHSSVMKMQIAGQNMYVYFAIGGVCGVAADGPERGKMIWELGDFAPAVVAPSPVYLGEGRILLTAGYGAGSAMIRVTRDGSRWKSMLVKQFRPQEGIASEQQTPVFYRGRVYSILPKDAGGGRNRFVGADPEDVTRLTVSSGKDERFGLGPYVVADDKFYILNDDGEMTIARVSGSQFKVVDRAKILPGQDAWGPLAVTGGYLLARDSKELVCMDIRKQ